MSKRLLWIGGVLAVLVVAGFGWMRLHQQPAWTTDSPAALAEFEAGMEAGMKMYQADAVQHFERALELDPDFVMAKLQVASNTSDRRDELMAELRTADLSRLTARERFLVRFALSRADHDADAANHILENYLSAHPDDVYALDIAARRAWNGGETERAQELYRRLLAVSPNYALAYNNLGYTAMQRGQFDKAEEYLSTYRYIAPDQANPHDSLGELYTLTGRYADAVRELEAAIRVKPDFWFGYDHLMTVHLLAGDVDAAQETVDQAVDAGMDEGVAHSLECNVEMWRALRAGWDAAWRTASDACGDVHSGPAPLIAQRAALVEGHIEAARAMEEAAQENSVKGAHADHPPSEPEAAVAHMEGVRLLAEGKPEAAVERFRAADHDLAYLGSGPGVFKLFNRLALATALERAGQADEAAAMVGEVRAVNPVLAGQYEAGQMLMLSRP